MKYLVKIKKKLTSKLEIRNKEITLSLGIDKSDVLML